MALTFGTIALRRKWTVGGKRTTVVDVTLDNAYVNGTGYTITNTQLGLPPKTFIDMVDIAPGHIGFQFTWVVAADGQSIVVRAWKTGAATSGAFAEASNNEAGLNGVVLRIRAIGN